MSGRDVKLSDLRLLLLGLHLDKLSAHGVDGEVQGQHRSIGTLLLRQWQTPEAVIIYVEPRSIEHGIYRVDCFEVLGH